MDTKLIKTITAKAGQSMWDIAVQEYGMAEAVVLVLEANPGLEITTQLVHGQELIIWTTAAVKTMQELIKVEPYASSIQSLLMAWTMLVSNNGFVVVPDGLWKKIGDTLFPKTDGDHVETSGRFISKYQNLFYGMIEATDFQQCGPTAQQHQIIYPNPVDNTLIFNQTIFSYLNELNNAGFIIEIRSAGDWDETNNGITWELRTTRQGQLPSEVRIKIDENGNVILSSLRILSTHTPSSSSATGKAGEVCWDANYMYVCIATNTWKRMPISTW